MIASINLGFANRKSWSRYEKQSEFLLLQLPHLLSDLVTLMALYFGSDVRPCKVETRASRYARSSLFAHWSSSFVRTFRSLWLALIFFWCLTILCCFMDKNSSILEIERCFGDLTMRTQTGEIWIARVLRDDRMSVYSNGKIHMDPIIEIYPLNANRC